MFDCGIDETISNEKLSLDKRIDAIRDAMDVTDIEIEFVKITLIILDRGGGGEHRFIASWLHLMHCIRFVSHDKRNKFELSILRNMCSLLYFDSMRNKNRCALKRLGSTAHTNLANFTNEVNCVYILFDIFSFLHFLPL